MLKRYGIIVVNISTDWRLWKITSPSTHRGRQQAKKFIQSRQTISSFINQSLYFKCPQKMMLELLISYSSWTSSLLTNHSHTECMKIGDPDTSYNWHFLTQYQSLYLKSVGKLLKLKKMRQPMMSSNQHRAWYTSTHDFPVPKHRQEKCFEKILPWYSKPTSSRYLRCLCIDRYYILCWAVDWYDIMTSCLYLWQQNIQQCQNTVTKHCYCQSAYSVIKAIKTWQH